MRHIPALGLLGVLLVSPATAQESSSTRFVLSQSTVNSGGGSSTSTSFVLDGSIAEPAPVGTSASTSYVLQAGFWTSLSTPVVLRVEGSGSGAGSATGGSIACALDAGAGTGTCSGSFVRGSIVDLVATPGAHNRFDGWSGCDATSTTTLEDDTCRVLLRRETTVSTAFTALSTVGDRVWRDVDGDGIQDGGEPGLDGVAVTIDDGAGLSGSVVTASDGSYAFLDVPPGTYTLTVDHTTLPAGTTPSFDPDGGLTPHTAEITVTDGEDRDTVDFGYQPHANLAIAMSDSQDPLPGGATLTYTITVQSLGPGVATGIEVDLSPPVEATLVATSGCAEDPAASPTCTLGTLDVGEMASYTFEVSMDPAPPESTTAVATVSSIEVDVDGADNSVSETTALDADPPAAIIVVADPPTADGVLAECETVHDATVSSLEVTFDEVLFDPAGDATPGDVTDPASWSLIAAGPNGQLDTSACGAPIGDDLEIAFDAVTYDAATSTATLDVAGPGLDAALLRLFACGSGDGALRDLGGTPLGDGDGIAGGDFVRTFRADPENRFANGAFDCGLGSWTVRTDPASVSWSADDVNASADSGSLAIDDPTSAVTIIEQCVRLDAAEKFQASASLWLVTDADDVQLRCAPFDQANCAGSTLGTLIPSLDVRETGSEWIELAWSFDSPAGSVSALCALGLVGDGSPLDARLDSIFLSALAVIFADGFETGDTARWEVSVP
ncbi:MAG: SdrD B-like domain-containing protein [Acidobacteriota bacterium]